MVFSRGFASGFVVSVGRPPMGCTTLPWCGSPARSCQGRAVARVRSTFTLDTTESVGMLGVWGRCIPLPLPPRRGVGATADGVVVPYLTLGDNSGCHHTGRGCGGCCNSLRAVVSCSHLPILCDNALGVNPSNGAPLGGLSFGGGCGTMMPSNNQVRASLPHKRGGAC